MKIVHCIHGLGLGGAQQVIKFLVRGLSGKEFRHFVYSSDDGVFREPIEDAGATVRVIRRRLPKFDPLWVLALAKAMRSDAIDVVQTHLFGDALHGYLAARVYGGVPVVTTLHVNAQNQTRLQSYGYNWLIARCTYTVACSESVRQSFLALEPNRSAHIETVPNGVEASSGSRVDARELRSALGMPRDAAVVGTVGRLVAEKGFDLLIAAFARLCQLHTRPVRLIIVGDGPLRGYLEQCTQREGVQALVVFTGFRSDVSDVVSLFDVFASSSTFEAMPIAVLEAMAAAKCIVATPAPGTLDVIRDGREGIIVASREPSEFASALRTALEDLPIRSALGVAAQQRFARDFTAEQMVSRYERIYRQVGVGTVRNARGLPSRSARSAG